MLAALLCRQDCIGKDTPYLFGQLEVTLEEVQAHLGVETQRQRSDKAILRTTPVLLGLFSLVTLWAHDLSKLRKLKPRTSARIQKPS
jgi:hypothetical protein